MSGVTSFLQIFRENARATSRLDPDWDWVKLKAVTLAAIRKIAFTLSKANRLRLADELLEASVAPFREPVTLATLERRAAELRTGKVKGISDKQFEATLKDLCKTQKNRLSS